VSADQDSSRIRLNSPVCCAIDLAGLLCEHIIGGVISHIIGRVFGRVIGHIYSNEVAEGAASR
jgi:hypothetical protein